MAHVEPSMLLNFGSNADPNPAFHSYADPDPASYNNADPDLQPWISDTYWLVVTRKNDKKNFACILHVQVTVLQQAESSGGSVSKEMLAASLGWDTTRYRNTSKTLIT
jgi:hypothetical protein